MKVNRDIAGRIEQYADIFIQSCARNLPAGLILFAAIFGGIQFGSDLEHRACASEKNRVLVPEYSAEVRREEQSALSLAPEMPGSPESKEQYIPVAEEKPILHKKDCPEEKAGGAQYAAGKDLVVEPESADFDTADEPIAEMDAAGPAVPPSPIEPQAHEWRTGLPGEVK